MKKLICGVCLCFLLAGCDRGSPEEVAEARDKVAGPLAAGTRAMVEELERLQAGIDPESNAYASALRVGFFENFSPPDDPVQNVLFRAQFAIEYLNAGLTRQAIELFEEVLGEIEGRAPAYPPGLRPAIVGSLGLSWLRLGEQENCIINHTAASCILPVEGDGIHQRTEGSRNAIEYFSRALREQPADLNNRWLLNIAFMTLGEYPENVPEEWLIPLDRGEAGVEFKPFQDIAPALGLDVKSLAGGSIVEDFTGNGYLDILTSSWGLADQVRFFVNNGDGTFSERTSEAGLTGITGGLNMVHADYTNNGVPDVLILRGAWMHHAGRHPNSLLRNNGDGTFTDVTFEAGLESRYPTQTAAWGDFNNNGLVDLFIGNEGVGDGGYRSELYRNNGDGTFTNIASDVGLEIDDFVKGAVWGDYNNDGYLDLYVSVLGGPNWLFRNNGPDANGDWSFTDVAREAGVREPVYSFPVWFWDFDQDGHLDLLIFGYRMDLGDIAREYLGQPATQAEYPRLYRNNGNGTFTDVTNEMGLQKIIYAMGCNFGDLDNDGYPDFYAGTGDPNFRSLMPNRMFLNQGGQRFVEVTLPGRFGSLQKGHGVSFADLNHNGAQDIHVTMGGAFEGDAYQNLFFENPGFGNNWLTVILRGVESNRMAVGARIKAVLADPAGSRELHRVVGSGGSFGGNPMRQHFGLGRADQVERLIVTWPASGIVQEFSHLAANQILVVTEGDDTVRLLDAPEFEYRRAGAHQHHAAH